jgi:hypothetical protein
MGASRALVCAAFWLCACGDADEQLEPSGVQQSVTLRADVEPVRSVDEAVAGVFIPPFRDCREPLEGERGAEPDGRVCTPVAISGCTEAGKYFPAYADCDVVRTQRPYWPAPPAGTSSADDPRLGDATFMTELAWVTQQVEASGCTCCHDSRQVAPSQWDIRAEPIWLDSLSDSGLVLFVGLADSSVLGAYPPAENHGFQRDATGIPSTDAARMQAFLRSELERRGISEQDAAAVPPFGGPIYANRVARPQQCTGEEGVDAGAGIGWRGGPARYIYVTSVNASNPGVPPNLDLPEGTIFRLDVLASQAALMSGVPYGSTPPGSFQAYPERGLAAPLSRGTRYRLYVLRDVGVPLANCTFTYGEARTPPADMGATTTPMERAPECSAEQAAAAFGRPCSDAQTHRDCGCGADYCAIQPGQSSGYCTATGCTQDPTVCPANWGCFDLSGFDPSAPSICRAP